MKIYPTSFKHNHEVLGNQAKDFNGNGAETLSNKTFDEKRKKNTKVALWIFGALAAAIGGNYAYTRITLNSKIKSILRVIGDKNSDKLQKECEALSYKEKIEYLNTIKENLHLFNKKDIHTFNKNIKMKKQEIMNRSLTSDFNETSTINSYGYDDTLMAMLALEMF